MSVSELKERHVAATETVNSLRERLKQKRLLLLDTDMARYARAQERSPVSFGPTDLVCCRTLQGHTGKVAEASESCLPFPNDLRALNCTDVTYVPDDRVAIAMIYALILPRFELLGMLKMLANLIREHHTPSTPTTPVTPSPKPTTAGWCVPKAGVSDAQLQAMLDYACGQGIDCGPIQPGGACFEPNTVASHASYAMNLYYQKSAKNPWNCDFSETATLTLKNPSYSGCTYPGGGA
ncbi:hypothetical protein D5086_008974 [Populus alba]|uniref:Uncharacterized protein n=1 Tax=Populus alba TaxID=43335 RepID=A0ACC4CI95_POPAL